MCLLQVVFWGFFGTSVCAWASTAAVPDGHGAVLPTSHVPAVVPPTDAWVSFFGNRQMS